MLALGVCSEHADVDVVDQGAEYSFGSSERFDRVGRCTDRSRGEGGSASALTGRLSVPMMVEWHNFG